tara:strand:+ start:1630 stop:2019 length:390 start_codon:yes stop_codon:yes gene_type:complete
MSNTELTRFAKVTTVNQAGEITVNAGRYSRGAVVAAFEMIGGLENFANWASENQSEFYTKLFGKTLGREEEQKSSDSVEEYLNILDGEAEDITDRVETVRPDENPPELTALDQKLAAAAKTYVKAHPDT